MSAFRYPYPIGSVLGPWREKIGPLDFDPALARLLERDQEMEDHLSRVLPQGYIGIGAQISTLTLTSTFTDVPGMTVTFEVPKGRRLKVTVYATVFNLTAAVATSTVRVLDQLNATQMTQGFVHGASGGVSYQTAYHVPVFTTPEAGRHTYRVQANVNPTLACDLISPTNAPSYLTVEDIGMNRT